MPYKLQKRTKRNISDEHLWLSIFTRPAQSSFDRMSRVTCCFVLLFLSMLFDILYYEQVEDAVANDSPLVLGPFYLTQQQVAIGFMTSLVVFLPSILVVELFRRAKKRVPHSIRVRQAYRKNVIQTCNVKPEAALKRDQTSVNANF